MDITITLDEPDALFECFSTHANSQHLFTEALKRKTAITVTIIIKEEVNSKEGNNAMYTNVSKAMHS